MLASEIRANARNSLHGKYGKAVLLILCYIIVMFATNFILSLIPIIGSIASLIISAPISYGLLVSFIKLKRNINVNYADFLVYGFSKFGKIWCIYGHTIKKMIIPIILVIIFAFLSNFSNIVLVTSKTISESTNSLFLHILSLISTIGYIVSTICCVIRGLLYSLTGYLLYDNSNMTAKEIVQESEKLMRKNRWNLVWLNLTFIGWIALSALTFYIGLLWLIPYIYFANICFYEKLSGKSQEIKILDAEINNPIL